MLNANGEVLKNVESEIRKLIQQEHPDYSDDQLIDFRTLINYRVQYIKQFIQSDSEEMSKLNEEVLKSIQSNQNMMQSLNVEAATNLTKGQKAADAIAKFGGSWPFIIIFISVLVVWILANTFALVGRNFDPYPFILLNLALSTLAALQAPIILMSQNRQAERDRQSALNDYKVNLKSEIEVQLLHEKIDYLIGNQWQHLVQIQQLQVELLQQLQEQVSQVGQVGEQTGNETRAKSAAEKNPSSVETGEKGHRL